MAPACPRIFIALLLFCALLVTAVQAQQTPVPAVDTTGAAVPLDSAAAPAPVPADSLAPVQAAPAVAAPAAPPPAQATPAAQASAPPAQAAPAESGKKIYYGGSIGFTFFGDVTRFYIQPTVGYHLTPRISVGGKLGYEHLKLDDVQGDDTWDNWGASVFSRLRILPALYGQVEYAVWSYDTGDDRTSVPYLLVGGGFVKPLGGRMALVVEAMVDVLQDEDSPYSDWEPWVTVGVQVGF